MTHDYKVTFTREEQIATIAASWLDAHASERRYITEFVENTLTKRLRKKDRLKIEYFDRTCKYDEPAYVTFRPLTLHVDRAIWYARAAMPARSMSSRAENRETANGEQPLRD